MTTNQPSGPTANTPQQGWSTAQRDQQRQHGLAIANTIRSSRARRKRELKTAGKTAPDLLAELLTHPPADLHTAQIGDVLSWLPRYGTSKVDQTLAAARLPYKAHIAGDYAPTGTLTSRQREQLAQRLRGR